ncbi:C-C motif chemokine 19a.1 [Salminus brasiliensis]|uniref:C-C motif chemokine 19a.1 n=1 Tax=Salminus brasiliensis TaxID=930266 RepID=UPI003B839478
MATTGVSSLCVALWITGLILSSNLEMGLGDQALDCCLSVSNNSIPKYIVSSYREQFKDEGCPIDAVIFVTKKSRHLCAPSDPEWVINLRKDVDKTLLHCQKTNFKGKRCNGMKP